jgi:23S rRNA G2445 N2-methylase RlmL
MKRTALVLSVVIVLAVGLLGATQETKQPLKQEIVNLGFPVASEGISGIETEGTMDDAMRLNLHLRTGHRVLVLLKEFQAVDPDELFAGPEAEVAAASFD